MVDSWLLGTGVDVMRIIPLQIPTTSQMTAREKRIKQLTEQINKLVEEVSQFIHINLDISMW